MGVSEKLFSFVPKLEAPVNQIYSWIQSDMEQTQMMLEAENALAVLKKMGEYAHRFPRRFWFQIGLLTITAVAATCPALGIGTETPPVETQIPIPTAQPEPSPTPVAPDATTTTGVETTPTTSPEGERLLGSNIPIMGGGLQLGTELIVGSIQKLPGDIPPEIIQNYGFVADAERQTGITVQAGLGGPSYFVSGSLEAVQELPLNQRESSPGIYVYGEEQSKIVVIGIREIIEGSQYFMGIGPDGQPVMIERTADGNYNILNDRDLQLPGEQDWVVGKLPDAQITMDLSTGYVTIGDQVHSINAEAPVVIPNIDIKNAKTYADFPLVTDEQLKAILASQTAEGVVNWGTTYTSTDLEIGAGPQNIGGGVRINMPELGGIVPGFIVKFVTPEDGTLVKFIALDTNYLNVTDSPGRISDAQQPSFSIGIMLLKSNDPLRVKIIADQGLAEIYDKIIAAAQAGDMIALSEAFKLLDGKKAPINSIG